MFIAFEGIDGSGKSEQAKLLSDRLHELEIPHILTKEPGATDYGLLVYEAVMGRDLCPLAQCLRFCSDRAQHYKEVINPALQEGKWVISDRSLYSTIAYDGYGAGVDLHLINEIHRAIPARKPDFVVWIDPPLEFSKQQIKGRVGNDKLDWRSDQFWQRVRAGYRLALAGESYIRVDSVGVIEDIARDIFLEVKRRSGGVIARIQKPCT